MHLRCTINNRRALTLKSCNLSCLHICIAFMHLRMHTTQNNPLVLTLRISINISSNHGLCVQCNSCTVLYLWVKFPLILNTACFVCSHGSFSVPSRFFAARTPPAAPRSRASSPGSPGPRTPTAPAPLSPARRSGASSPPTELRTCGRWPRTPHRSSRDPPPGSSYTWESWGTSRDGDCHAWGSLWRNSHPPPWAPHHPRWSQQAAGAELSWLPVSCWRWAAWLACCSAGAALFSPVCRCAAPWVYYPLC